MFAAELIAAACTCASVEAQVNTPNEAVHLQYDAAGAASVPATAAATMGNGAAAKLGPGRAAALAAAFSPPVHTIRGSALSSPGGSRSAHAHTGGGPSPSPLRPPVAAVLHLDAWHLVLALHTCVELEGLPLLLLHPNAVANSWAGPHHSAALGLPMGLPQMLFPMPLPLHMIPPPWRHTAAVVTATATASTDVATAQLHPAGGRRVDAIPPGGEAGGRPASRRRKTQAGPSTANTPLPNIVKPAIREPSLEEGVLVSGPGEDGDPISRFLAGPPPRQAGVRSSTPPSSEAAAFLTWLIDGGGLLSYPAVFAAAAATGSSRKVPQPVDSASGAFLNPLDLAYYCGGLRTGDADAAAPAGVPLLSVMPSCDPHVGPALICSPSGCSYWQGGSCVRCGEATVRLRALPLQQRLEAAEVQVRGRGGRVGGGAGQSGRSRGGGAGAGGQRGHMVKWAGAVTTRVTQAVCPPHPWRPPALSPPRSPPSPVSTSR